jgi:hypothetical protein
MDQVKQPAASSPQVKAAGTSTGSTETVSKKRPTFWRSLRSKFRSYRPGTSEYWSRHKNEIDAFVVARLDAAGDLGDLSEGDTLKALEYLRRHETRVAQFALFQRRIVPNFMGGVSSAIAGALSVLFAYYIYFNEIGSYPDPLEDIASDNAGFVFLFWILAYFPAMGPLSSDKPFPVWRERVGNFWAMFVGGLYLVASYRIAVYVSAQSDFSGTISVTILLLLLRAGMLGTVVLIIFYHSYILLVAILAYLAERLRRWLIPEAVVVDGLVSARAASVAHPEAWIDLEFKRKVMAGLEDVACTVERDLPRKLRSRDAVTDLWIRNKFSIMAARIRILKRWLIAPLPDTREKFITRISKTLSHTLLNDWEFLERESKGDVDVLGASEPETGTQEEKDVKAGPIGLTDEQKARSRVWTGAKWILVTLLAVLSPLALLFAASQANLLPQDDAQYRTLGIVLTLVGLLSRLDPLFKDKLEVASSMIGGGK